jgi:hypothetical protein
VSEQDFSSLKKGDTVLYYAKDRRLTEYEVASVTPKQLKSQALQEWLHETRYEQLPEGRELLSYTLSSKSEYADYDPGPGWGARYMHQESATPESLAEALERNKKNLKPFRCIGEGIDYRTTRFEEVIYAETEEEALEVFERKIRNECDDVLVDSDGGPWAEAVEPDEESEDD